MAEQLQPELGVRGPIIAGSVVTGEAMNAVYRALNRVAGGVGIELLSPWKLLSAQVKVRLTTLCLMFSRYSNHTYSRTLLFSIKELYMSDILECFIVIR